MSNKGISIHPTTKAVGFLETVILIKNFLIFNILFLNLVIWQICGIFGI